MEEKEGSGMMAERRGSSVRGEKRAGSGSTVRGREKGAKWQRCEGTKGWKGAMA